MNNQPLQLLIRHKLNPILTVADCPYPANSIFNPGATLLPDGTTLLLCRVEDRRGLSHLSAALSVNGIDNWKIDDQPTLAPDPKLYPEEIWGIEDPRITYLPELEKYAVVYTAYSLGGPCVSQALTKDFHSYERFGVIMQPDDKDAAILPRRINNRWALIHRPIALQARICGYPFLRICKTGAGIERCLKLAWVDGGTQIKLASQPLQLRLHKVGW